MDGPVITHLVGLLRFNSNSQKVHRIHVRIHVFRINRALLTYFAQCTSPHRVPKVYKNKRQIIRSKDLLVTEDTFE